MSKLRPRGLGRGLEALIPLPAREEGGIPQVIDIDQIRASSEQVRVRFEAEGMRELAESIREHGLLQPVLVKRIPDGYELIAGERRWRAARMAGLKKVPALIRTEREEGDQLLLGLIENLQRKDLDPIEEAQGIKRLIEQFGLTHEQAAARLGRHRVAVSQSLRLLNSCPALLSATAAGAVSAGHARALVGLPTAAAQEHGLKVVLAKGLSVRQTERWVSSYQPPRPRRGKPQAAAALGELAGLLSDRLKAAVSIVGGPVKGRVVIEYTSREELERIRDLLTS